MTQPGSEFIAGEMDLRRRMRNALRELGNLARHRPLIYQSNEEGVVLELVEIDDVMEQLYFALNDNYDDPDCFVYGNSTDKELEVKTK